MPTGPMIILTLKILVSAVTVLLLASLVALLLKKPRLHGRINTLFFILTMSTVAGFEILLQFVDVKATFDEHTRGLLRTHLYFSVPSAILLPIMFFTGWTGRKSLHLALAVIFMLLWTGTFITGVFYQPHS